MTTTYYPIRIVYVGPDHAPLEERDYIVIQTTPGYTNLGNTAETDGWLGTTDDWAAYALGEYSTPEEARQRVAEEYEIELQTLLNRHTVEVDDWYLEPDEVERYSHVDTTLETWQAEDYCQGGNVDRITGATTDGELNEIAEDILIAAEVDNIRLEGDVLQVLRRIRESETEDADDDDGDDDDDSAAAGDEPFSCGGVGCLCPECSDCYGDQTLDDAAAAGDETDAMPMLHAADYCHCHGAIARITTDTTDYELRGIAENILIAAEADRIRLDGDILRVLRQIRASVIEAAGDEAEYYRDAATATGMYDGW